MSRLNYAKLYTVEHNVKVFFIGKIAKSYEQKVVDAYNGVHMPLPDRPELLVKSTADTFAHAEGPEPSYSKQDISSSSRSLHPSTATPSSPTPQSPNQTSNDPSWVRDPEHNTPDVSDNIHYYETIDEVEDIYSL
jgi:hypothetical protein